MELWRVHRWTGWLSLLAFVGTGIYLLLELSAIVETGGQAMRIAYRSNHIYLLASGLVNLCLALALRNQPELNRPRLATAGTAVSVLAPIALVLGYIAGPTDSGNPSILVSIGVTAMAVGAFIHLAAGRRGKTDAR